ncbi:MAG: hypothetical protein RLW62_10990 [Gammaproteobacteria bacterium]
MRHLSLTVTWTVGLSALMASLCLANPLPWLVTGLVFLALASVMLVRELARIAARSRREPTLAELGLRGAAGGDSARAPTAARPGAPALDGLDRRFVRS